MGASSKVSRSTAARIAAATVGVAVLLVGPSACGSDGDEAASTQQSTGSASPAPKREAGVFASKGTRLAVVNKTGNDLQVTICGDGTCKPARTLGWNESEDMAADTVNGWVRYNVEPPAPEWEQWSDRDADGGGGSESTPKQPFQIDFRAWNPDVGLPGISLTTPSQLCEDGPVGYGPRFPGDWDSDDMELDVDKRQQPTESSLCNYKLIGSRAADSSDYKTLTLEAYPQGFRFPDVEYASG